MLTVRESPVLYDKTKGGRDKMWLMRVLRDQSNGFYLQSEFWQQNDDGGDSQHQTSEPIIVSGKNVGRSNQTTDEEQAYRMLDSYVLRQKDRGYHEMGEPPVTNLMLPMLAQRLNMEKIRFPVYLQPKYNGVRAPSDGRIFWSRKAKIYPEECTKHLRFDDILDARGLPVILDGELMLPHHDASFQKSISAIKKFDSNTSPRIMYFVYDCFLLADPEASFSRRHEALCQIVDIIRHDRPGIQLELAPTELAKDAVGLQEFHKKVTSQGFEGTMVRTVKGKYLPKNRSSDLMKYKDMQDQEFKIVGWKEGKGKDAGTAIFSCLTPEGMTFSVRPEGTLADRQNLFRQADNLIGRMMTVRFQELSDDGLPIFPVGVSIRDYE